MSKKVKKPPAPTEELRRKLEKVVHGTGDGMPPASPAWNRGRDSYERLGQIPQDVVRRLASFFHHECVPLLFNATGQEFSTRFLEYKYVQELLHRRIAACFAAIVERRYGGTLHGRDIVIANDWEVYVRKRTCNVSADRDEPESRKWWSR